MLLESELLLTTVSPLRSLSTAVLLPSHGPLRFITSHSFRARLCHAKNEAPEEEAGCPLRPSKGEYVL